MEGERKGGVHSSKRCSASSRSAQWMEDPRFICRVDPNMRLWSMRHRSWMSGVQMVEGAGLSAHCIQKND